MHEVSQHQPRANPARSPFFPTCAIFTALTSKRNAKFFRRAKTELMRHSWDTFVDDPPSVAQGGKGVVVSGCPACKKQFGTNTRYLEHLVCCPRNTFT